METVIRRAVSGDYAALCVLFDEADRLHRRHLAHIFQAPEGPARSRAYLEALLANPQVLVLVAERGGRPVGCLVAALRPRPSAPVFAPGLTVSVESLAVDPRCQRQGVGRALMAAVDAWAAEQGASSLELNVYAFNEGAIAFYRALGYEVLAYKMERRLT